MYFEVLIYLTIPFGLLVHNIPAYRFAVNKKYFSSDFPLIFLQWYEHNHPVSFETWKPSPYLSYFQKNKSVAIIATDLKLNIGTLLITLWALRIQGRTYRYFPTRICRSTSYRLWPQIQLPR